MTDSVVDAGYYVYTLPKKIMALKDFISDKCALSSKLMDTEIAINEALTKEINGLGKIDFTYDQDKRDRYEKVAKDRYRDPYKSFTDTCKWSGLEILSQDEI